MQNFPKLTFARFAGLLAVFATGSVLIMVLPVKAQVAPPESPAAQEVSKTEPAKPAGSEVQTPAPLTASPAAVELFQAARKKLRTRMYKASIVQRLNFPDRTLQATGRIACGQKFRMRLEFQIKSGSTVGELLQVCDGDKLWTERRVNDVIHLTEQDVKQILQEAKQNEIPENMVIAEMGLGGITSLLASLERTMVFGEPMVEKVDGEELLRVNGQWNAQFLAALKGNPQFSKGLPQHVPDGAIVYFDRDDFPRRIQYVKKLPKEEVLFPVVTVDFLDLEWLTEADLNPKEFEFHAPDRVIPRPVTDKYLNQLKPMGARRQ